MSSSWLLPSLICVARHWKQTKLISRCFPEFTRSKDIFPQTSIIWVISHTFRMTTIQRWNHDTSTTNIKLIDQNESLALSTNENDCFIELIAYILRKCWQKDWKVTNLWKLGTNSDTKWISNASDVREYAIHGPLVWLKRTLNMYVNAVLSTSIERSFHSQPSFLVVLVFFCSFESFYLSNLILCRFLKKDSFCSLSKKLRQNLVHTAVN